MTLRSKLSAMVISFLLLTAALAAGSFLIFNRLNNSFDTLRESVKTHNLNEEIKSSISELITSAETWAITGNQKYKGLYREKLAKTYKDFGAVSAAMHDGTLIEGIGRDFGEIKNLADNIMAIENPVGNKDVNKVLRVLEAKEEEILKKLTVLHSGSIAAVAWSTDRGDEIKDKMAFYLAALFILSSFAFLFLAVFMRKMIAVPFNDILTATDRIISGNFSYRIGTKRKDEFGVIADRFDKMVEELQQLNIKNEALYLSTKDRFDKLTAMIDFAKAITSTLDLEELLKKTVENASRLFHARGGVLRLLEGDRLAVKTSYGLPKDVESLMTLPLGEGLPGKVAKEGKPIMVDDLSKMPADWRIPYLDAHSVMNVPLMVSNTVVGTLGLYDKMTPEHEIVPFSDDDLSVIEGFASLSAIAINKAMLFSSELQKERDVTEAKIRLDLLFETVKGGIIILGTDYKILSSNKYMEHWLNMPADEIIGKNCLELFHGNTGICPHCAAQLTCETGVVNTIAQSSGARYAELTAYPVKDESGDISECIVFVMDITDMVLQQEEVLTLYSDVAQTKAYLESLIDNSADAIVTSDLNGIMTSWNKGAEKIYGFSETEAIGKYLPFVPEYLKDTEKANAEKVKNNEVVKAIETVRQRKDGSLIEISLTLSPIKNAAGNIIGISGISRDISEKKIVEKELIRKNQELSRLFFISSAMRSTLELDRLLRMILTAVTMGDGLGFNRAVLFLVDEKNNVLKGSMGVGPASHEEASSIWGKLYHEKQTLESVMMDLDTNPAIEDSFLDRLSRGIEVPLDIESVLMQTVKNRQPYNVADAKNEPLSDAVLIQLLGTEAYATVPLVSRGHVIGVLWVDNLFNKRPITSDDIGFLSTFSNQIASAIESAKLFEKVSFAEAELDNIFMSMSDMMYITDMNCNITSVNKAVTEKFGIPKEQIAGQKCHKFFHGMNEPWANCPHLKALETKKSYMEEHDDPYLGGTFLSSCSPMLDASGNILGTVHIVRDTTELKNIREKLAGAERMAALGEVAARVAHEIRNPLVSVGGFALRLESKLDGNLKEYASIITNETKRLEMKLKDILGFVREARLAVSYVNINELLLEIVQLLGSDTGERNITIETRLGEIPGVTADRDRIREALINIINNAIQAIVNNGTITITTYVDNGLAAAEITDTGPGIAEKDVAFIFDPFYTTKAYGTGLGLAITRRVIEEHKGKIEVKSKPGEGTTMKVYLPIAKEEA